MARIDFGQYAQSAIEIACYAAGLYYIQEGHKQFIEA